MERFGSEPLPERFANPCLPLGVLRFLHSAPPCGESWSSPLLSTSAQENFGSSAPGPGTRSWEETGRDGPPSREKRAEGREESLLRGALSTSSLASPQREASTSKEKEFRRWEELPHLEPGKRGFSGVATGWPGTSIPEGLGLAQAPQKEKAESASAVASAGHVSQHFLL